MQKNYYLMFIFSLLVLIGSTTSCNKNMEDKTKINDKIVEKKTTKKMELPEQITNYQNTGVDFNNENIALTKGKDYTISTYSIEAISRYDNISLKSILIIKYNADGSCTIDHLTESNILIARLFYDKDADLIDAEIPTEDIVETKGTSGWYGCVRYEYNKQVSRRGPAGMVGDVFCDWAPCATLTAIASGLYCLK